MVSRLTAALAARYKAIQEKEKGFTLIELLVVVIIIGVLAAIAIPIYIGVQESAKDSAVKSDLTNAKIAVTAYYTEKSALPDPEKTADLEMLKSYGWTQSAETAALELAAGGDETNFCIEGSREGAGTGADEKGWFSITSAAGVKDGGCK